MKIDLNKIKKELKRRGFFSIVGKIKRAEPKAEIYLVGGAVRDLIMGRDTTDFDFVVRNAPIKKLEKILSTLGKVNFVGKTFGVFKLVLKNNPNDIDIALPRTDFAFNTGGHKDFKIKYNYKLPIEKDLSRRDFTINAMALRVTSNQLPVTSNQFIDPFNGLKDLKKKIIRTVGQPEERFREDYSRMLRAIRIACELNFRIEPKTWLAIKKQVSHLNDIRANRQIVPAEVIAKELLKALKANVLAAFDLFDQAKIFKTLIPEIEKMKGCPQPEKFHTEGDVFKHTRGALEMLSSKKFSNEFSARPARFALRSKAGGGGSASGGDKEKPPLLVILATLFHDIGKPPTLKTPEKHGVDRVRFDNHDVIGTEITEKIVERLKLTSPAGLGIETKKLLWLIRSHMFLLHVHGRMDEVRVGTIEKYFFNPEMPSQDLLKLFFVDILASRPQNGKPFLKDYYSLKKRIKELVRGGKKIEKLPPPLLNGHEIMRMLKLESSPIIGKIKGVLREAQLEKKVKNKKEALEFIKKRYGRDRISIER